MSLPVEIVGQVVLLKALVLPTLTCAIILGIDFIKKHQLVLNFATGDL